MNEVNRERQRRRSHERQRRLLLASSSLARSDADGALELACGLAATDADPDILVAVTRLAHGGDNTMLKRMAEEGRKLSPAWLQMVGLAYYWSLQHKRGPGREPAVLNTFWYVYRAPILAAYAEQLKTKDRNAAADAVCALPQFKFLSLTRNAVLHAVANENKRHKGEEQTG